MWTWQPPAPQHVRSWRALGFVTKKDRSNDIPREILHYTPGSSYTTWCGRLPVPLCATGLGDFWFFIQTKSAPWLDRQIQHVPTIQDPLLNEIPRLLWRSLGVVVDPASRSLSCPHSPRPEVSSTALSNYTICVLLSCRYAKLSNSSLVLALLAHPSFWSQSNLWLLSLSRSPSRPNPSP